MENRETVPVRVALTPGRDLGGKGKDGVAVRPGKRALSDDDERTLRLRRARRRSCDCRRKLG